MASTEKTSEREARLLKLFNCYIHGEKSPKTSRDAKLYLEAITSQPNHLSCVEHLAASKNAMEALKLALRFDVTETFLDTTLKDFLLFLQDPAIAQACNGGLLKQILTLVVFPETIWTALVSAHADKKLSAEGELVFAWLLLQLISWVDNPPITVDDLARDLTVKRTFLDVDDRGLRNYGYRIENILQAKKTTLKQDEFGPGGRHDNDHPDFRKITIFPTEDELMSTETPFYRPADAIAQQPFAHRPGIHVDNQFRLLREDFLAELKEDVKATQTYVKGRRPRTRLQGLSLVGAYCGNNKSKAPFALTLSIKSGSGMEEFALLSKKKRTAYLKDNPKFLRHQSFGCIVDQQRVITFASLVRVEELLVREEDEEDPLVVLRAPNRAMLEKMLSVLKSSGAAEFIMLDTPVFAYEPVLRCLQSTVELPLWQELFAVSDEEVEAAIRPSELAPLDLIEKIEADKECDLQDKLSLSKSVILDTSQMDSFLAGLRQSVSLIQGPPGTGKSFIGALLTKALVKFTSATLLVICYTNHALDQFLEDLLDIGIPAEHMVRLGAKSTPRTETLQLFKQKCNERRPYALINALRQDIDEHETSARRLLSSLQSFKLNWRSLMDHLEFSDADADYFDALHVDCLASDMQLVGEKGRSVTESYLYERWRNGHDAGVLSSTVSADHGHVWAMSKAARAAKIRDWTNEVLQERIGGVGSHAESYDRSESLLRDTWEQKTTKILQSKRIIACTTTAAAKYTKHLRSTSPGIVLVEEAGEILESHVLTAMTPNTKQLILIGDHQQLRPKVNNYALTVEKGEGYDLNRSLFERLVRAGIPHTTLCQQHRMCPEISSLVRELTYPGLVDAPSTLSRDLIKGLNNRVVFVNHREHESAASQVADRRDEGDTGSKQNAWEASMILQVVRYMGQQGYGTAQQVVLTPYLGQLNLLRRELAKENDPVLNDLDSHELIRAGLMLPSSAPVAKRQIRLSTIDNYQGEESDIVIASLTRSNSKGEIGFMAASERLNVLLSRARKALIIIGDSETFLASRRGACTWRPFFDMLTQNSDIHDGLPVRCEQHPDRQNVLRQPSDFDRLCPEGGCSAPCGTKLSCGIHNCPLKCHAIPDHSKMPCIVLMTDECPKKHTLSWRCSDIRPPSCPECDFEAQAELDRLRKNAELDVIRQQKQADYAQKLAEIEDEIDRSRRRMREQFEDEDQELTLRQRRQDLENVRVQSERAARDRAAAQANAAQVVATSSTVTSVSENAVPGASADPDCSKSSNQASSGSIAAPPTTGSPSKQIWDEQKRLGALPNQQLDQLMSMIGLESVKEAFLDIKAKVELAVRQNTSLAKERFGVSFLGNPGTGKTTVARLYARFLTSVGALPGSVFVETTGAKLAHEGVKGCKDALAKIIGSGGGALFIDEAYQLTSGNSPGGLTVLDYLLPEMENLTGKVVVIVAGYNRNMEKFFAHNPGLPSRFPRQVQFADFEDDELLEIFNFNLDQRYGRQPMKVEDGSRGLYARIVSRRIGRGRGTPGFGNARAVENAFSSVVDRQAKRIEKLRRVGQLPDDWLFTREDMIGPEPSGVLKNNQSWRELQQMIGLSSVKESVAALLDSIRYNYQRELEEKPIMEFSLNKVFLGSPGTGKTTVAHLYGQILADIGMLSSNEVLLKTPADFISNVIGGSEANSKSILDSARGKVLVIDEAYGLCDTKDSFKVAVINTIVSEVQNIPGDDRCVLLLGYKEQMEDMMQEVNPGLARRFPIDSGFLFEDFTDDELSTIFDMKLKKEAFTPTPKARSIALDMLSRMRNRPNFGNAGAVDILLNDTKIRQQKRFARDHLPRNAIFEAEDFDPDHVRSERAITNIEQLFRGDIGCAHIVDQLKGYQKMTHRLRGLDMDPREELPFTFLFRGPPGTGKTTTARKMGKVYYDMGFLASAEVVECSATNMIGEYLGHTGPKTRKLMESALGKVLFIDEAYRLCDGAFAQEAVDEMVDCMTKPRFLNKIIIILAGYDHEINKLMDVNPGLSSRFTGAIDFMPLSPEGCYQLLQQSLQKKKHLDLAAVSAPSDAFRREAVNKFEDLASLGNFANGRDVLTIAKGVVGAVMTSSGGSLTVSEDLVKSQIDVVIDERKLRILSAASASTSRHPGDNGVHQKMQARPATQAPPPRLNPPGPSYANTNINASSSTPQPPSTPPIVPQDPSSSVPTYTATGHTNMPQPTPNATRDDDVSDAVWQQLQEDVRQAEEERQKRQQLQDEEEILKQWLEKCANARRQRELKDIERKKRELEEKLHREAEEKSRLEKSGRCPRGFQWIRQTGGYRCAGGSHWVPDGEVKNLGR